MVQVNDVVVHDKEGGSHTLVATVEDITDSLRLAEDLRQAQQMEALGQLAGGIAHEINTPTQFISDNLSFLSRHLGAGRQAAGRVSSSAVPGCARAARRATSPPRSNRAAPRSTSILSRPRSRRRCPRARRASSRVATIVRAMKAFGRPDPSDPEPTDIDRLVANAVTMARNKLKYVAEVKTDLGAHPTVVCFPGAISQVVLNLLVNAAYAVGESTAQDGRNEDR